MSFPALVPTALLRGLSRLQLTHFLAPLVLLAAALPGSLLAGRFHYLGALYLSPILLLVLGAGLCIAFQRWRQLSLLVWIQALGILLLPDIHRIETHGLPTPAMLADFIVAATWWPSVYCVLAVWPEQSGPARELVGRGIVMLGLLAWMAYLHHHPGLRLLHQLATIWWPAGYAHWMQLPQLSYPLGSLCVLLLALQYLYTPSPQAAAQLLVLPACMAAMPHIFIHPALMPALMAAAMLALAAAVVHESMDLAFRDELTGLPSRRALNERLLRLRGHYCLAVVDIDHFKRCNDTYGHDVGDQVLRMVASRLRRIPRGRAYRQGGEEFVIVLERCTPELAFDTVEALRQDIADYPMQLRDTASRQASQRQGRRHRGRHDRPGTGLSVTVSIGLAAPVERQLVSDVLKRADKALYRAKTQGRNQTILA
ncbi:GGDEF domain-containing protein [Frateuria aurantia]